MTKRVVFILGAAFAALSAGVVPALADTAGRSGTDWACVVVVEADLGICQQNPLPDELSVPKEARVLPPK
ncbi:MAG TPA: hypothetical protein VM938_08275 [Acidimicrobiales bacterium]|nr:hypothetical protein [Acidimicrobiales bacterium]